MATQITEGNYRRLIFEFKDENGNLADPSSINAYVLLEAPGAQPDPITPTKDSTGIYHHDYYFPARGRWWYGGSGNGAITATCDDQYIDVRASRFPIPTI